MSEIFRQIANSGNQINPISAFVIGQRQKELEEQRDTLHAQRVKSNELQLSREREQMRRFLAENNESASFREYASSPEVMEIIRNQLAGREDLQSQMILQRLDTDPAAAALMALDMDLDPASSFTLSAGQTRFDADGNPIASVAQPALSEQDRFGNRSQVRTVARNMRKDMGIDDILPNFETFRDAIGRGTGTGDTVAIITAAKILDPGSVVREGEVEVIKRSDGLFGQLQASLGQLRETGQVLGDGARAELASIIRNRAEASRNAFLFQSGIEKDGFRGFVDDDFLDRQFRDPFKDLFDSIEEPQETQPDPNEGAVYTNPGTGQTIVMRGGRWVDTETGEEVR